MSDAEERAALDAVRARRDVLKMAERRAAIAEEVRQMIRDINHWNRKNPGEKLSVDEEAGTLAAALLEVGLDLATLQREVDWP